jgi:hypothetical protein
MSRQKKESDMETSSKIIYSLFICIFLFMMAFMNIDVFPTNDMSLFWLFVISDIIIGVLAIAAFWLIFTSDTIK